MSGTKASEPGGEARALSARNARLQHLARLVRHRSVRLESQSFVLEGVKVVGEALAGGFGVDAVFVDQGGGGPVEEGLDDIVRLAVANGVSVFRVASGALKGVLGTVTPQPVAALAPLPSARLGDLGDADMVLVLVGVADPGNAGTLLRTAEAAGAGGVVCTTGTVDPFGPKCVRASAGAVLRTPIVTGIDAADALRWLGENGIRRLATALHDGEPYDRADLLGPVAVVLGNEAHGLPPDLTQAGLIDECLTIPMAGRSDSLNVAMAGAIICFETSRQRRAEADGLR